MTETKIHSQAIVEDGAEIGEGVVVGPFCHVGSGVKLGEGTQLISHVSVAGDTHIGKDARIFPFASVGHLPQDLKYKGEKSQLRIGEKCLIREGVTINTGTDAGGNVTSVGDNCVFLAYSHVAHDCSIANNVIVSNAAMIAGHCDIGNNVIFGGGSAIHQFCRVGSHAFIGGVAAVENDVLPFGIAIGNRAHLGGVNLIGMKRAEIARESIHAVRNTFKLLFDGSEPVQTRAQTLMAEADDKFVIEILEFVMTDSDRGLCVPDGVMDE